MALRVRITRSAASQIEEAHRWWSENRLSVPDAVLNDVAAAFDLLARQPGIDTRLANTRTDGVRRLHLGRVRYHLFYRVTGDELVVLSLWHAHRGRLPTF